MEVLISWSVLAFIWPMVGSFLWRTYAIDIAISKYKNSSTKFLLNILIVSVGALYLGVMFGGFLYFYESIDNVTRLLRWPAWLSTLYVYGIPIFGGSIGLDIFVATLLLVIAYYKRRGSD